MRQRHDTILIPLALNPPARQRSVLSFFRAFANACDRDGTPPLLRMLQTARDTDARLLRRVMYLCALGSELDGCDARGYTAVDHCAEVGGGRVGGASIAIAVEA